MNCTTFNIGHKIILLNKVVQMNYFPEHPSWWIRSPLYSSGDRKNFCASGPCSGAKMFHSLLFSCCVNTAQDFLFLSFSNYFTAKNKFVPAVSASVISNAPSIVAPGSISTKCEVACVLWFGNRKNKFVGGWISCIVSHSAAWLAAPLSSKHIF